MQYSVLSVSLLLQDQQIRAAVDEYADYHVFELDNPGSDEPTVHVLMSDV